MNDLVVVPNVFENFYFNKNAIESIRYACTRWKVNFFEVKQFMHVSDYIRDKVTSNRLWMMKYFTQFDRVLILDPDIVINSKSPNIFNELESYDFAAVHNANPTRMTAYSHMKPVTDFLSGVGVNMLEKHIPNFNRERYYDVYFNGGVYLFNPKTLAPSVDYIINLLETNEELNMTLHTEWIFIQNLISAILSTSNLKIKTLEDKWNWIAPDINLEWDMFCGPMHSHIYHFTGTDGSKESMNTYDGWK